MLPGRGRSYGPLNHSVPAPYANLPLQKDLRTVDEARNPPSGRETVLPRGRLPGPPNVATGQATAQVLSPRSQSSAATARSPLGPNGGLERRPSIQGYHHTNRSHGGHQHARNASFVNSPATSPLSPQTTPAEYIGMTIIHHGTPELRLKESPTSMVNISSPLSGNATGDKDIGDGNPVALTQKKVDRVHGGKPRQGPPHQKTHSRQHHQEQKTVGEYALHHLFTSVCCYRPP